MASRKRVRKTEATRIYREAWQMNEVGNKIKNPNGWGESSPRTGNEKNILCLRRKADKLAAIISLDKLYQKRISLFCSVYFSRRLETDLVLKSLFSSLRSVQWIQRRQLRPTKRRKDFLRRHKIEELKSMQSTRKKRDKKKYLFCQIWPMSAAKTLRNLWYFMNLKLSERFVDMQSSQNRIFMT